MHDHHALSRGVLVGDPVPSEPAPPQRRQIDELLHVAREDLGHVLGALHHGADVIAIEIADRGAGLAGVHHVAVERRRGLEQRRVRQVAIDGQDPVGERRVPAAGVVGRAADAHAEDDAHGAVAGLVLGVVAGEVADREGVGAVGLRLDVLHQAREVAEVRRREEAVGDLRAVHEIDLVVRDVPVEHVVPRDIVRRAVARDRVAGGGEIAIDH
jgi:hypothetical protein